uniref:No apical meristem-associated C-terminal domain-containing protein n=1 Tax=Brassica oleracea var. oleracea TaxID=109376 RepID=A0A0D3AUP2_BRAOL
MRRVSLISHETTLGNFGLPENAAPNDCYLHHTALQIPESTEEPNHQPSPERHVYGTRVSKMRGERGSVYLFRHFSLSRNGIVSISYRSSEKAILLLSPWIVDIPAILPLSTTPNGILCLCGSPEKAILPLSPWIYWNRKSRTCSTLFIASAVLWQSSCGASSIAIWLNTSKDPVVGYEQKSATFWTRVAAYFSASPKLDGCEKRDGNQCKQRWQKLNEAVCKFSGGYEAATREKTSGLSDNDVLKLAHEIYFNNQQKKFSLEHAWNELRNDQKWCELATSKTESSSKRRKFADGSHSGASSQVNECDAGVEGTSRPPGVKAAKARGKKPHVEGKDVSDYQLMWSIKKDDLAMKQQLSKMRLLEKLLAKENLANYEEDLKKKLINELIYLLIWTILLLVSGNGKEEATLERSITGHCDYKPLFMHIVDRLSNEILYFREKKDGLRRISLSPLQKCTAAIRVLAYGSAADAVDEYLRLGETTTWLCVENFVEGIIYLFGDEYLRRPTPADLQRLLDVGEYRGFLAMIGSIDCMHWEWKNCPTAWKGQYSRGSGKPTIVLETYLSEMNNFYPIYSSTTRVANSFICSTSRSCPKRCRACFWSPASSLCHSAVFWDKVKIGKIMRACIILHNMIVENERDVYTQYDVSEFQKGEDNGRSYVDLTYSTYIPTNIANQMSVQIRIRDRQMHQQLKDDLVQHI